MEERTLDADEPSLGLEATLATNSEVREAPRRGLDSRVDRYVILDLAGAGAMGMVLAAYDPELDRKVAVKLLKLRGDTARARLQREAQALAKLDHPNVVAVYDVGSHEGQLFMAMEFVAGQTLRKWATQLGRPRPWREVLEVFSAAGRGLAAAHAAELVHRDFKPDNVMIGDDGRVRVMDFGLARMTQFDGDASIDLEALTASAIDEQVRSATLTRTGALMGTPAYMSLEQYSGKPADARSDQFGFCVALYEALYGERPFVDDTLADLLESLEQVRLKPTPVGMSVPPWVRKAVLRGLAADPEARWPSMNALLEALADDPRIKRRRWLALAGAAGLIAAAAWAGRSSSSGEATTCTGFEDKLAGMWDATRKQVIAEAFSATGRSYAPGTWARVEPRLDAYAQQWVHTRRSACEATQRGEQSQRLLDLRMACLDRRLTHLQTTLGVFAQADADIVEKAVTAVDALPPLEPCADTETLLTGDAGPRRSPADEAAYQELERQLAELEALAKLGKFDEAHTRAKQLLRAASERAELGLEVRTQLELGDFARKRSAYAEAEAELREAYRKAIVADMDGEAGDAAIALIDLLGGSDLGRVDEGRTWLLHAQSFVQASADEQRRGSYLLAHGQLELMAGEYAQARAHFQQALDLFEDLDADHPRALTAMTRLASVASYAGDYEAARANYERALAAYSRSLDPAHPRIARMYMSLGMVASQAGRHADAQGYLESAVEVFERGLGPQHPTYGYALTSLAFTEGFLGAFDEAVAHVEQALDIYAGSVGREHYFYAEGCNTGGAVAFLAGDYAKARRYYECARDQGVLIYGAEHPTVGVYLGNLAEVAVAEQRHAEALELSEQALATLEPKLGAAHPNLRLSLLCKGEALIGLERREDAREVLERARAIEAEGNEVLAARVNFALARALAEGDQARELATQALATFEADAGSTREAERARAWLGATG